MDTLNSLHLKGSPKWGFVFVNLFANLMFLETHKTECVSCWIFKVHGYLSDQCWRAANLRASNSQGKGEDALWAGSVSKANPWTMLVAWTFF